MKILMPQNSRVQSSLCRFPQVNELSGEWSEPAPRYVREQPIRNCTFWTWFCLSMIQFIGLMALFIEYCIRKEMPWIIGLGIFIGFELAIKVIVGRFLNKSRSSDDYD